MTRETASNDDETLEVEFEIENGSAYLTKIFVYVDAIGDQVEVPKSLDKNITKAAEALVADFMDNFETIINDRLESAAMMECKDYEL